MVRHSLYFPVLGRYINVKSILAQIDIGDGQNPVEVSTGDQLGQILQAFEGDWIACWKYWSARFPASESMHCAWAIHVFCAL